MRRLAFIAMLAACGGDGGGPIDIDELEPAVVNAICNLYVNCGLVEDQATCKSLYTDVEVDEDLIAAVKAGKVIYHPDKARECLNSVWGSCERNTLEGEQSPACDETFEGTVAAGGGCAMDEECISQNCEVPGCTEACCQGTCVGDAPPVRPRAGETCDPDGIDCTESFCDVTTMICTAYRATGQPCESSSECASGVCSNQMCTALPGPNEACSSSIGFGLCNELGYHCSATTMTCVAYGLTGDPCTTDADCSPVYQCGANGTCELGPTLGEPCGTGPGESECVDRSYCEETTMTCTAPIADGGLCGSDSQCASGNCDFMTNTCVTQPVCI